VKSELLRLISPTESTPYLLSNDACLPDLSPCLDSTSAAITTGRSDSSPSFEVQIPDLLRPDPKTARRNIGLR
jgi:hypothetical protein